MAYFTREEIEHILQDYFDTEGKQQYIGARYLTLFGRKGEDTMEWDNGAPYEPLTVVVNEGNSYVSRTYVPTGIDISDTRYWLLAFNFNAQVEQYRRDVIGLADNVDDINDVIGNGFDNNHTITSFADNTYSLSYVGYHGAKENDDTIDWQAVIDSVASVSTTIDFGSGQWKMSSGIVIPSTIRRISGRGSLIIAVSDMDYMIDLSRLTFRTSDRFFMLDGISFDGANKADVIIKNEGAGNATHVFNCTFRDFNDFGIYSDALGATIGNCLFANQTNKNTGCGIYTKTDSKIFGCKFFYLRHGLACGSGSVTECYFFTQYHTEPTYGICGFDMLDGNTATTQNVQISSCEFDCITYCICQLQLVSVSQCLFYWNGTDDTLTTDRAIFYSTGATLRDTSLLDCTININEDDIISGNVRTFITSRTGTQSTLRNYLSRGCMTKMSRQEALAHIFVSCGFAASTIGILNTDHNTPTSPVATHFTRVSTDVPTTTLPTLRITSADDGLVFSTWHFSRNSAKKLAPVFNSDANIIYKTNDDFYITVDPRSITEIIYSGGSCFDMCWDTVREAIDSTAYDGTITATPVS